MKTTVPNKSCSLLGGGVSGFVYLVKDTHENDAPRVLKEMFQKSPRSIESSRNEIDILRRLTDRYPSENIVKLYDSFEFGFNKCLVMEYCEDGSLESELSSLEAQQKTMRLRTALSLLKQLASAIDLLHNFPDTIIHRDIKPEYYSNFQSFN